MEVDEEHEVVWRRKDEGVEEVAGGREKGEAEGRSKSNDGGE